MVTEKQLAEKQLAEYFYIKGTHTVSSKGVVNVKGDVTYTPDHAQQFPRSLPVKFGKVTGDFWAGHEKGLQNWTNFPEEIGNVLYASQTDIKDLINSPRKVGSLLLQNSPIESLKGMPSVSHHMDLGGCLLKNLQGMTRPVTGYVSVINNPLESLDGFLGCDQHISVTYHKDLGMLRTLMAKGGVRIYPPDDSDNVIVVDLQRLQQLEEILNRYKGQGQSGAIACAAEMAQAGFKGNARW
jgi:hypothetical protein